MNRPAGEKIVALTSVVPQVRMLAVIATLDTDDDLDVPIPPDALPGIEVFPVLFISSRVVETLDRNGTVQGSEVHHKAMILSTQQEIIEADAEAHSPFSALELVLCTWPAEEDQERLQAVTERLNHKIRDMIKRMFRTDT